MFSLHRRNYVAALRLQRLWYFSACFNDLQQANVHQLNDCFGVLCKVTGCSVQTPVGNNSIKALIAWDFGRRTNRG